MLVEYRLMKESEMQQLFDFWVEVYPETECDFFTYLNFTPLIGCGLNCAVSSGRK